MGLTNKYFSNATDFEDITEALRTVEDLPAQIDSGFLSQIGCTDPADGLILNFFKELKFLTEDNAPTALLEKFRDPSTSKEAFVYGILEAYGDLFEEDPAIYQKSKEEVAELLESKLDEKKSNIIISYMVNTFKALVDYVGEDMLESLQEQKIKDFLKERGMTGKHNDGDSEPEPKDAVEPENDGAPVEEEIPDGEADPFTIDEEQMSEELESYSNGLNADMSKLNGAESNGREWVSQGFDTLEALSVDEDNRPSVKNGTKEIDYINRAYIKKAELLYKLDRYEEALPALDNVYRRFNSSDDAQFYKQASLALIKKMKVAEELERNEDLIPIYSEIIGRLGVSENPDFVDSVDHAYMKLPEIQLQNDNSAEALDAIDAAVTHFKKTQRNPDFLAEAMYTKAELLEESEANEEALKALDDFLITFG